MARTHLLLSVLVLLLAASGEAETLFGPVVVQGGETYTGSFGMNCACTAYFVEARVNQGGKPRKYTIKLNGENILDRPGDWTCVATQVELLETELNEIGITVDALPWTSVTVEVYERDVTPAPMVSREYMKLTGDLEKFGEGSLLNHWANLFYLQVVNGNPDETDRVTSGTIKLSGVPVITPEELNDEVGEITKVVDLGEGTVRFSAELEGPVGSKIEVGIKEAAQAVTVTQVWEKDLPWTDFLDGAIRVESGEPVVTLSFNRQAVRITEDGSEDRLGEEESMGIFISPTGRYTGVRRKLPGTEVPGTQVLDGEWVVISQTDAYMRAQLISDDGNTIASLEGGGFADEGEDPCDLSVAKLYDVSFSPLGIPIPIDYGDVLFTRYRLSYDGSCLLALCGEGQQVNMHARDGSLLWTRTWRFNEFMPVAEGRAVLASPDTMFMVGPGGEIERRVTGPSVNPGGMGCVPRLTSEVVGVQAGGDGVRVALWQGPQSCWEFEPTDIGIAWEWASEDGRWLLVGGGIGNSGIPVYVHLVGAGGEAVWSGTVDHVLDPWVSTAITAGGEYFLLHSIHSGDSHGISRLYRVTVE